MKFLENTRVKPEVISFRTIRRSIGVLGIILPFALLLFGYILGCKQMQPSISHYYYTMAGSILVGILCAVGLFLISYKGFGPLDDFATNLAGVFAFGIAFFPTGEFVESTCSIFSYPMDNIRSTIHYVSAAFFFITLAGISFFLFTRSDRKKSNKKIIKNRIYRTCAILMILFIALIPICSSSLLNETLAQYHPTFWLECGALISFGVSWLVKGEVVLKGH